MKRSSLFLNIPHRFNAYVFRAFDSTLPPYEFYKVVFASDLEHANRFIHSFCDDQGLDLHFHYLGEDSSYLVYSDMVNINKLL